MNTVKHFYADLPQITSFYNLIQNQWHKILIFIYVCSVLSFETFLKSHVYSQVAKVKNTA